MKEDELELINQELNTHYTINDISFDYENNVLIDDYTKQTYELSDHLLRLICKHRRIKHLRKVKGGY